jgi:hypothetical protein
MDRAIFDLIGNAKSTAGGNYIRDGKGRLIIDRIALENKTGGAFFIAEFVVEKSEKVPVTSLLNNQKLEIEPNGPGTSCSVVTPINNPKIKSGPGNAKAFILSLLGYTEDQVSTDQFRETMTQLVGKDQPAKGMVLDYETYRKLTRDAPVKELVLPRWTHVAPEAGNSAAEIAKRRAELEKRSSAA